MANYDKALNNLIENGYEFKFSQYIQDGFELYKKFIGQFTAFYLIIFLISIIFGFIPFAGQIINVIINIVFYPVLIAGALLVANELIKDKQPEFNFFFKGFDFFVPILTLTIVSSIFIFLGFILLIIPGIYLLISYSFATMFIIFLGYDYWTAMEWSRKIISKQWWNFLGFLLVLGLINVGGLLLCGVGIIFTAPATMCMSFCAFEDIVGNAIKNYNAPNPDENIS